ncbi:MAG: SpoIIE family protein phosphatase, partial [Lachnospiraceae bacterium]|nr:SpoIIE family protein phosphatase [Lachnospiraceae bacterium]
MPGDTVYEYTDGVSEATNANDELFGNDRLIAALNKESDAGVEALLKNVRMEIDRFVKDAPQFDD